MVRQLNAASRAATLRRIAAIPDRLKNAAEKSLNETADRMVQQMRLSVQDDSGALAASIDKEDRSRPGRVRITVTAGGPTTTRQTGSGKPYDYARAVEFGTDEQPPQPFFRPVADRERGPGRRKLMAALRKAAKES